MFKFSGMVHGDALHATFEFQIEPRGDEHAWLVIYSYGTKGFRTGTAATLEDAWLAVLRAVHELNSTFEAVIR